jgi:hypothetical protein
MSRTSAARRTTRPRLPLPQRELGDPEELVIPIGPTGILVGAALRDDPHTTVPIQRDDMIMWSLTDPQRATRVVMDTSDFYVRQLLLRAAAVGERIAIFSNSPQRWVALSQPNIAVVERDSAQILALSQSMRCRHPVPLGLRLGLRHRMSSSWSSKRWA